MKYFVQKPPKLCNQYQSDSLLKAYLKRTLPQDIFQDIKKDLDVLGEAVSEKIFQSGQQVENETPFLNHYDAWGNRIDEVVVSPAWEELQHISAREGLIAIGYERHQQEYSRLYQFAKLYLFTPSSGYFTCPLAMADGAARLLELFGTDALKQRALKRLTSRNPELFWTSGQWMTERIGGSDVGQTETTAHQESDGSFRLYGDKWFTSAVTSAMAITLARIEDEHGNTTHGSRGLSLFYLETYLEDGSLNHIEVNRLKDKLGTKAVPTAELSLKGTYAQQLGQPGEGVKVMSNLFNITRIYNAMTAVSMIQRAIALAKDYATRREAFGKKLSEWPLHTQTLADLEGERYAAFLLCFYTVKLLGKEELEQATSEESALLRILTPLAKLYTAKQAVAVCSEVLEAFGGAGYVEDTGLPQLLRNAQVLPIWEGTTNVLSLDTLRSIAKEQTLEPFLSDVQHRLQSIQSATLESSVAHVQQAYQQVVGYVQKFQSEPTAFEAGARGFAYSLSRLMMASLLLEHAQWCEQNQEDLAAIPIAKRWCQQDLVTLTESDEAYREASDFIVFGKSR